MVGNSVLRTYFERSRKLILSTMSCSNPFQSNPTLLGIFLINSKLIPSVSCGRYLSTSIQRYYTTLGKKSQLNIKRKDYLHILQYSLYHHQNPCYYQFFQVSHHLSYRHVHNPFVYYYIFPFQEKGQALDT